MSKVIVEFLGGELHSKSFRSDSADSDEAAFATKIFENVKEGHKDFTFQPFEKSLLVYTLGGMPLAITPISHYKLTKQPETTGTARIEFTHTGTNPDHRDYL